MTRRELPTAAVYHELTKYSEQELLQNPRQIDWSAKPSVYKDLVSDRKVDLATFLPFSRNPFTGGESRHVAGAPRKRGILGLMDRSDRDAKGGGQAPAPSMADPAPRGCLAAAAARCASRRTR